MNKSIGLKRTTAIAISFLLLCATALGGVMTTIPTYAAPSYSNEYNVDLSHSFQEFDGWGLSLSWWATEIGDWTRKGSSGMQKREEIMEAIYGKSGLNLNIARYNVGGGDDPTHTHMTDDRNTPGWRGAYLKEVEPEIPDDPKAEEGEGEEKEPEYVLTPNELYYYQDENGNDIDWQNTPDHRQLWVLDWIQKDREARQLDDLITEYYSNSPPYWMTKTGCSSGGVGKGDNLTDDNEHNQAFVEYFLDVYEYLVRQGFVLQNLQPFNESGSKYWGEGGDQEGCYFSPQQKIEVLAILRAEMAKRGIDVPYNFGDETNTNVASDQYNKARSHTARANSAYDGLEGYEYVRNGGKIIDEASRLTYHIYDRKTDTMQRMYHNAHSHGQEIYMSEICYTQGDEYDPNAMDTGFTYTESIIDTVKNGGVDAYVFWQGMEDMVGQMKSGTNYGLIQGVYYTQEEAEASGVDLAAMGLNYQDFVLSKAYYLSGQYTKYIEKGYTLVEIDENKTLAAISPDGKTLVIVRQNKGDDKDTFKINLGGFKASSVEKIYTDETHNWAKSSATTDGGAIYDTVNKKSVTTYVIHGTRTGRDGYFIDDSDADTGLGNGTSVYSLANIQAQITANPEAKKAYATYNVFSEWGGEGGYFGTSYRDGSAGTKSYMAYRFKGIGFELVFPKKGDAGAVDIWIDAETTATPTAHVDLYSEKEIYGGIVYSRKDLDDTWHTVYVGTNVSAHKDKDGNPTKWVNFDGMFVIKSLDDASESSLYISDAAGVANTLSFTYEVEGYTGYTLYAEYRKQGEVKWNRSTTALSGGKGSVSGVSGTLELRIAAVKDDYEEYSPAYVAKVLDTTSGVLYFVDCGTGDENAIATGAVLGEYQSSSDKKYGVDSVTGKSWGYTNNLIKAGDKGYYAGSDAMSSVMSTEKVDEDTLTYKFGIPEAGTYKVAIGFFGGGSAWGARTEVIGVASTSGVSKSEEITLEENKYDALYYSLSLTESDELTVSVAAKEGEKAPLLSLIVITKENVRLPLYTSGASNYNNEAAITPLGSVSVGDDMFAKFNETSVDVFLSNGETDVISAGATGVSLTASTVKISAGQYATATLVYDVFEGLEAYATYSWYQEGARELYYNIDIGYVGNTPPEDAKSLGSKQSTTKDRVFGDDSKGTSWGCSDGYNKSNFEDGVNWKDDGSSEWSIREAKGGGNLTYKMTGFASGEALEIKTGGHCGDNWGGRTYDVQVNGTVVGTIELKNKERTYDTFECTADDKGVVEVVFVKNTGDNPQVGYIQVWSSGGNLPRSAAVTADKAAVDRDGKITLRNLIVGGAVYAIGANGEFYGCFKPTETTQEIDIADYISAGAYTVNFVQAEEGYNVSLPYAVDVPALSFDFDDISFVRDGDAVVIKFLPLVSGGVTSLVLTTPDGVNIDLTEGFFYRAKQNGDYTVTLVSNGVSSSREFTVSTVDVISFGESFSTSAWTTENVTVTLDPKAQSGITRVLIDGVEATAGADGKYTVTATENTDYEVTLFTEAGYEYTKTVSVANIDKSAPELALSVNFSAIDGVTLGYTATSLSGGSLKVSFNDGDAVAVVDGNAVNLAQEGKYEITYVGGNGVETTAMTYYVTYGVNKANLATVTLGEDGTVTVTDKTRATPSATLYKAGSGEEVQKADKAGKYYLAIENGADKEVVVFTVEAQENEIIDNTKNNNISTNNGNVGGMIAGIVIGCLALVAAAVVCALVMIRRKRA